MSTCLLIYIIYTANCIKFGKHKHIKKKAYIAKSVTVNTLINLYRSGGSTNVPKTHNIPSLTVEVRIKLRYNGLDMFIC